MSGLSFSSRSCYVLALGHGQHSADARKPRISFCQGKPHCVLWSGEPFLIGNYTVTKKKQKKTTQNIKIHILFHGGSQDREKTESCSRGMRSRNSASWELWFICHMGKKKTASSKGISFPLPKGKFTSVLAEFSKKQGRFKWEKGFIGVP